MGKTILLVDDEADMVKLTSFRLTHAGYEVLTAPNSVGAFEFLKSKKVDLILLDIHLPTVSGYEICKTLRENEETKKIPVLFFSASSLSDTMKQKIEELGAQGFVQKPFKHEELIKTIQQWTGG